MKSHRRTTGAEIRERWSEGNHQPAFGATSPRPRRTGWSFFKATSLAALGVAAFFAFSVDARAAAILEVDGSGELTGARDVDIGGDLFDVEFVDTSCSAAFDGCDASSDFAFTSESDALAAAQALLDQVFVDSTSGSFDSLAASTFGCNNATSCEAAIPFTPFVLPTSVPIALAKNCTSFFVCDGTTGKDSTFTRSISRSDDLSGDDFTVYARFEPSSVSEPLSVPEPGTLTLMGLGLVGLAAVWRRLSPSRRS